MAMLLGRDEMTFDFRGARLDPVRDRELVEWTLNQFLYGEMTGIQCGHWLYDAPDLEAARFLARQSLEEMQHVDNFLRMLGMMGMQPRPAHPMVRFLTTGMMGDSWAEHVALEMAAGEGFVLLAFYAVIDTLEHKPSVDILRRAVKQEERHVEFGEQQTMKAIAARPGVRRRLAGLNLVSLWGVRRLAGFMASRLPSNEVLAHLPAFLELANRCAELRMLRIGLIDRPLAQISSATKAAWIAEAYGRKLPGALLSLLKLPFRLLAAPFRRKRRLTETYLRDPYLTGFVATSAHGGDGATDQAA
jgi:bacterioferritin (cytochrome b1)